VEVKQTYRDDLVDLESALEMQERSAHMRSITNGRPPKGFSTQAVEKSVIAALVSDFPLFLYHRFHFREYFGLNYKADRSQHILRLINNDTIERT
jgi:hypothetical protein